MPSATIDHNRTGGVRATIANGAPTATIGRADSGGVTATLNLYEPGESP